MGARVQARGRVGRGGGALRRASCWPTMRMSRIMDTLLLWFSHSARSTRSRVSPCAASMRSATRCRCAVSVSTRPLYSRSPYLLTTMLYALLRERRGGAGGEA